jgi:DNA-binding transcriptional regulator YiaG
MPPSIATWHDGVNCHHAILCEVVQREKSTAWHLTVVPTVTILGLMATPNRGALALRRILDARQISQAELAAELGVAPSAVSRWLSGDRLPERATCAALVERGIPLRAWDEPADDESTPSAA